MSRDELITNIGTIAKSGTRQLLEQIKQEGKSAEVVNALIGRFGVGFYSAFMVADKVSLVTRRAGEDTATHWESTGDGHYTLAPATRARRGTSITLHLKPVDTESGIEDYTQSWVLSRIVKRYSDFVAYPIQLKEERDEVERDEQGAGSSAATETGDRRQRNQICRGLGGRMTLHATLGDKTAAARVHSSTRTPQRIAHAHASCAARISSHCLSPW